MIYLVEHEGNRKPLSEIESDTFQNACAPVVRIIEQRLGDDPFFDSLEVVFRVDPEAGLQFDLRGEPVMVNAAIDRIGEEAPIPRFDA